jgi:hypothetical protein
LSTALPLLAAFREPHSASPASAPFNAGVRCVYPATPDPHR